MPTDTTPTGLDLFHEARQLVAELELMSHGNAMSTGTRPSSEHPGGKRPTGGVDRHDDREPDFEQKSHAHFQARLRGCRCDEDVKAVIADAKRALDAWRRTPAPTDPLWGTFECGVMIANSELPDVHWARIYCVSKARVGQVKRQFRGVKAGRER
jgi:hypothetical protein